MHITLGVTGGVAAYKAAEVARRLQQEGFSVQAVMTRSAREFVAPLTFAALTGQKVITELFGGDASGGPANVESAIEHIAVAQRTDLLLVVPATADVLAKFARGIADDFLSTLYLATTAPVVVAPAMNVNMWQHTATQENLETLRTRGVRVVEPGDGYLACGMTGPGRLAEIDEILAAVRAALYLKRDLEGETVLVTAGPTREDLDPVRYLTNRSSGKMGYAVAEAARRRGARVILVSGPTALTAPEGAEVHAVRTAEEMRRTALEHFGCCTMAIFAAAVADYRPARREALKMKREQGPVTLTLEPTADILAEAGRKKGDRVVAGFAAETDHLLENARKKLAAKHADIIVANDVTSAGAGFDGDTNIVTIVTRDGHEAVLPQMSKFETAQHILDEAMRLRAAARKAPQGSSV
ncbi:MAG TPA: bifunctional phosphopantothenoylcysteine decarboxylase/phosphopantothenate--cysteine ligase CoaBC [Methylomirabilota bacterium]|nr:bifunctional phosphopantothenoylcysteine decarboxylase/phosphopantothenate--cysteine ligase CoaBC [Methylomirabilota bacterium]